MHKRLAGKLSFIVFVLFAVTGGLRAQDNAPEFPPAFLMNTPDGLIIYGANWENEVAEIGRLPANMGINTAGETYEWAIDAKDNFVLSPDHRHIAIVANSNDQTHRHLFIYHFDSGSLDDVVEFEQCPYGSLFITSDLSPAVNWSPDSQALTLLTRCSREKGELVYRLSDQLLRYLPDYNIWGVSTFSFWGADSSTLLLYDTDSYGISLFDIGSNIEVKLANLEHITLASMADRDACNFTWSAAHELWFFEVGCLDELDSPIDYLYSLDLDGNVQLEVALPDFYAGLLSREEFEFSGPVLNVHSIVASDSGVYLVLDMGDSDAYHSVLFRSADFYDLPEERFGEYKLADSYDFFISPNQKYIALRYDDSIQFYLLDDGELTAELSGDLFDVQSSVRPLWLDAHRVVYRRTDGRVGLFNFVESMRAEINLSADLKGDVILFNDTIGGILRYQSRQG